jgi:hypothetical protein
MLSLKREAGAVMCTGFFFFSQRPALRKTLQRFRRHDNIHRLPGLFGLATFTAQRSRKEIGIRKISGASATTIVALLSKDFVKLVITGL